jgi:hypothetical protein
MARPIDAASWLDAGRLSARFRLFRFTAMARIVQDFFAPGACIYRDERYFNALSELVTHGARTCEPVVLAMTDRDQTEIPDREPPGYAAPSGAFRLLIQEDTS